MYQDLEGEDQDYGNGAYQFDDWFAKQKNDLMVKAYSPIPENFPDELWNWEACVNFLVLNISTQMFETFLSLVLCLIFFLKGSLMS